MIDSSNKIKHYLNNLCNSQNKISSSPDKISSSPDKISKSLNRMNVTNGLDSQLSNFSKSRNNRLNFHELLSLPL